MSQFIDTGLANGTRYYYSVSGVNAVGEGPRTTQVSAVPAATTQNPAGWHPFGVQPNVDLITLQTTTAAKMKAWILGHRKTDDTGTNPRMPGVLGRIVVNDQVIYPQTTTGGTVSEGQGYGIAECAWLSDPSKHYFWAQAKQYADEFIRYYDRWKNARGFMHWNIDKGQFVAGTERGIVDGQNGALDGDEDAAEGVRCLAVLYPNNATSGGIDYKGFALELINNIQDYCFVPESGYGAAANLQTNGDNWGFNTDNYMADYTRLGYWYAWERWLRSLGFTARADRWKRIIKRNIDQIEPYLTTYPAGVPDRQTRAYGQITDYNGDVNGGNQRVTYNSPRLAIGWMNAYCWYGPDVVDPRILQYMNIIANTFKAKFPNGANVPAPNYSRDLKPPSAYPNWLGYETYGNLTGWGYVGGASLGSPANQAWMTQIYQQLAAANTFDYEYFNGGVGSMNMASMAGIARPIGVEATSENADTVTASAALNARTRVRATGRMVSNAAASFRARTRLQGSAAKVQAATGAQFRVATTLTGSGSTTTNQGVATLKLRTTLAAAPKTVYLRTAAFRARTRLLATANIPTTSYTRIKINFQTAAAPVPEGYVPEIGRAFDVSRGYGWEAVTVGASAALGVRTTLSANAGIAPGYGVGGWGDTLWGSGKGIQPVLAALAVGTRLRGTGVVKSQNGAAQLRVRTRLQAVGVGSQLAPNSQFRIRTRLQAAAAALVAPANGAFRVRTQVQANASTFAPPVTVLDNMSSTGATGAYGLRRLRSSYAGNACRVRRASDNATMDVDFAGNELNVASLQSWLGAADGYIDTWYDQSGNNVNLGQYTNANQWKIANAGVVITRNGKPAIYAPDTSRGMAPTDVLAQPYTNVYLTVIMVGVMTAAAGGSGASPRFISMLGSQSGLDSNADGLYAIARFGASTPDQTWGANKGGTWLDRTTGVYDQLQIVESVFNNGTHSMLVDGSASSAADTYTPVAFSFNRWALGISSIGSFRSNTDGYVSEFYVILGVPTPQERVAMRQNTKNYFGTA